MSYPTAAQYWDDVASAAAPFLAGDVVRTEQLTEGVTADFALVVGPATPASTVLLAPLRLVSAQTRFSAADLRAGRGPSAAVWVADWHEPRGADWFADLDHLATGDAATAAAGRVAIASGAAWVAVCDRVSRHLVGIPIDGPQFLLERAATRQPEASIDRRADHAGRTLSTPLMS